MIQRFYGPDRDGEVIEMPDNVGDIYVTELPVPGQVAEALQSDDMPLAATETIEYERASYHINPDRSKGVVVKVWVAGDPQQYEQQVAEDFMNHRTQGMVIEPLHPSPF